MCGKFCCSENFSQGGTIKQIKLARMVNHLNSSLLEKFLLMSMKIIKGEYFYREGAEFLRVKKFDGEIADVWINFASSGQQEILWV